MPINVFLKTPSIQVSVEQDIADSRSASFEQDTLAFIEIMAILGYAV